MSFFTSVPAFQTTSKKSADLRREKFDTQLRELNAKIKREQQAQPNSDTLKKLDAEKQEIELLRTAADASNIKIKLNLDEYVHSFNEQLGFIFKELNLYSVDKGKALLKASKYLYRMGGAVKHIEQLTGKKVKGAIPASEFAEFGKRVMDIKVNEALSPADQKEQVKIAAGRTWQGLGSLTMEQIKTTLLEFSVQVQKIYIQSQGSSQ